MKLQLCMVFAALAISMTTYASSSFDSDMQRRVALEESVGQIVTEQVLESVDLPTGYDTAFKAYMDYRCITDTTSKQYNMQNQAYTDENGLRKIGDYYCVAMGSGVSSEIGQKYEIELDSGQVFRVIQADQKDDRHTDSSNRFIDLGNGRINIVEFIVATESLPDIVRVMGNVDYMPNDLFKGQIVEIREVVDEENFSD